MAYKNRVRLSVPVSYETDKELTELADKLGMTKTSLCTQILSYQIENFKLTYEMMKNPQVLSNFIKFYSDMGVAKENDIKEFEEVKKNFDNLKK